MLTRPYKFRLQTPKPCIQEAPVQVLRSSFMQVQHEALRWMFAPSGGALNNTHLLNPYYCCHPIFGRFTLIVLHEVNVITLCSKRTDRPNPLDPQTFTHKDTKRGRLQQSVQCYCLGSLRCLCQHLDKMGTSQNQGYLAYGSIAGMAYSTKRKPRTQKM